MSVVEPARETKTGKRPKVLSRVLSEIGALSGVLLRVLSRVLFLLFSTERTPGEHSWEHSWQHPALPRALPGALLEIFLFWALQQVDRLSNPERVQLIIWPFFTQISGRNPSRTLWRGPSRSRPSPSSALCPLLYRTEHFSRGRKGRKGAQRRGWPAREQKGNRTRENKAVIIDSGVLFLWCYHFQIKNQRGA